MEYIFELYTNDSMFLRELKQFPDRHIFHSMENLHINKESPTSKCRLTGELDSLEEYTSEYVSVEMKKLLDEGYTLRTRYGEMALLYKKPKIKRTWRNFWLKPKTLYKEIHRPKKWVPCEILQRVQGLYNFVTINTLEGITLAEGFELIEEDTTPHVPEGYRKPK